MSIKDSFKNISNSYISLVSIPQWIKIILLSLLPILGISILLNQNNAEFVNQKLKILGIKMNQIIDYFNLNDVGNHFIIYVEIVLSLIIFLYFFRKYKNNDVVIFNTIVKNITQFGDESSRIRQYAQ